MPGTGYRGFLDDPIRPAAARPGAGALHMQDECGPCRYETKVISGKQNS